MHWAAAGGDLATLILFIERGAPLEARSEWSGTVLETAVWCRRLGPPAPKRANPV
jgi:ankyrin repeat protein